MPFAGKINSGRRDGAILQIDDGCGASRHGWIAQENFRGFVAEDSQITAGVYASAANARRAQTLNGAINRETFRDSTKIDGERPVETDPASRFEPQVAERCHCVCYFAGREVTPSDSRVAQR
jgi:hypothetical protein